MDLHLMLKGLVMGFSIAAPVGPIGVLCIRRTLAEGQAYGLISGLGAATADAVYGCVAGFGLSLISGLLVSGQLWLRLIGGAFLLYLGVSTFLARPADQAAGTKGGGLARAYTSTFLLTLSNPMTIMSFAAVFAGLGPARNGASYGSVGAFVSGVFLGSALWWLVLSGGVSLLRGSISSTTLRWVNRASGIVVTGFGLYSMLSLLIGKAA